MSTRWYNEMNMYGAINKSSSNGKKETMAWKPYSVKYFYCILYAKKWQQTQQQKPYIRFSVCKWLQIVEWTELKRTI